MKKVLFFAIALVALSLTSCSKEETANKKPSVEIVQSKDDQPTEAQWVDIRTSMEYNINTYKVAENNGTKASWTCTPTPPNCVSVSCITVTNNGNGSYTATGCVFFGGKGWKVTYTSSFAYNGHQIPASGEASPGCHC